MHISDISKAVDLRALHRDLSSYRELLKDYPNVGRVMYIKTNPSNGTLTPIKLILSEATRKTIDMLVKHDLDAHITKIDKEIAAL